MSRVLITGCSTGIGRATAIELTKRGHDVVATARRPETLDDLDVAARLALDVDDDASVRAAVAAAGELDALVNNAGFGVSGPVEQVTVEHARSIMETNFFGAVRMIQAVLPQLRDRSAGTIVNVTSLAGRVAPPLGGFYAASKYALEALSESLHYEVGHFGIKVRIVEPGIFSTAFQGKEYGFEITPPYDELEREWEKVRGVLTGGEEPSGPEPVAAVIADALESDEAKLRWPVGADAEMILAVRATSTDEEFEATMRGTLDLQW
jgi:NAD(P)-dependent dehydrogenase (short-subunit alcohol dehydrogenase family)